MACSVKCKIVDADTGAVYSGSDSIEFYASFTVDSTTSMTPQHTSGASLSFNWGAYKYYGMSSYVYDYSLMIGLLARQDLSNPDNVKWSFSRMTKEGTCPKTVTGYDQTGDVFGWKYDPVNPVYSNGYYTSYSPSNESSGPSGTLIFTLYVRRIHSVEFDYRISGVAKTTQRGNVDFQLTLPTPTDEMLTGRTFLGWYNESGLKVGDAGESYSPSTSLTLHAEWETPKYTVSFEPVGGSEPDPSQKQISYGEQYGNLPTCSKPGHSFEGWWTAETGGSRVYPTTYMEREENHVLYAHWEPIVYGIAFNPGGGDGGSCSPVSYKYSTGQQIVSLTRPTRDGYDFDGWEVTPDGYGLTVSGDSVRIPPRTGVDISITAKWKGKTYSVDLHINGGSIDSGDVSEYVVGVGATLPTAADVSKRGHAFAGWYGNSAFSGQRVYNIGTDETGPKEFYAKWSVSSYRITLYVNGGTVVTGNVTGYSFGSGVTLPTDVTRSGKVFGGWYSTPDFSGPVCYEVGSDEVGDKEFYAKWLSVFRVTFRDRNGVVLDVQEVMEGEDAVQPRAPVVNGYSFSGWSGDYTHVTEDRDLRAQYTIIVYSIQVESAPGTGGSASPSSYSISESPVVVTLTRPVIPDGYEFGEWRVSAPCSVTGDILTIPAGTVGNVVVRVAYTGSSNYSIKGRRWQCLYTAARSTPVYTAEYDAILASESMQECPWKETAGDFASCLTGHPGTEETDEHNVSNREFFDAAAFCAGHENGMHRVYAQATCYRFSLPPSAVGATIQTLTVLASGDPYLKDGARIVLMTNSTGVIPSSWDQCRTGDIHVDGVVKRRESDDGAKWYGTTEEVQFLPDGGIELEEFLFIFVFLENYAYTRGEYVEGSACIHPVVRIGLDTVVTEWSLDGVNKCYENGTHVFEICYDGYGPISGTSGVRTVNLTHVGMQYDGSSPGCSSSTSPHGHNENVALRALYAALYEGRLLDVPVDSVFSGVCGEASGISFVVRRDSVNTGGGTQQIPVWQLTTSSFVVPFSVPTSFRANAIRVRFNNSPIVNGNSTVNVWLKRGEYLTAYPSSTLENPAIYDASLTEVDGFELIGTIPLPFDPGTDHIFDFPLGIPLDGYVASLLFTAFTPLDDSNVGTSASDFHPHGICTEVSVIRKTATEFEVTGFPTLLQPCISLVG